MAVRIFTPTYRSWNSMRSRCLNPKRNCYHRYGGDGITVCDRWALFANFLADMGERPEGTTLDRINNAGNYEPGNCRWATPKQQRSNMRKPDVDITGGTFGRLTVMARAGSKEGGSRKGRMRWHCQCTCGKKAVHFGTEIRQGFAWRCGRYCGFGARPAVLQQKHRSTVRAEVSKEGP